MRKTHELVGLLEVNGSHDNLEALRQRYVQRGIKVNVLPQRELTADIVRRLPPGTVLVLHWPTEKLISTHVYSIPVRSARFFRLLFMARRRSTAIVWVVHNSGNHQKRLPRTERLAQLILANFFVDGLVALNHDQVRPLERLVRYRSRLPVHVLPLPTAASVYGVEMAKSDARRALHLPETARVFVCLGRFKWYKGQDSLADAWSELREARLLPEDVILLFAGRPDDAHVSELLGELSERDSFVRVLPRFLTRDEVRTCVCAADWLVLPYREIENSGVAYLALTYGRPVIGPDVGGIAEIMRTRDGRTGGILKPLRDTWLIEGMTEAIALTAEDYRQLLLPLEELAERLDPVKLADDWLCAFRTIASAPC